MTTKSRSIGESIFFSPPLLCSTTVFPDASLQWSHAAPLFSSDKCLCCKELSHSSAADESALQLPGSRAATGPLPPLLPVTEDTVCAINNTKLPGLSLDTLAPLVIKSWKQIPSSGESPRLTWDRLIKTLGSRAGNHGIPVHGGNWGKWLRSLLWWYKDFCSITRVTGSDGEQSNAYLTVTVLSVTFNTVQRVELMSQ